MNVSIGSPGVGEPIRSRCAHTWRRIPVDDEHDERDPRLYDLKRKLTSVELHEWRLQVFGSGVHLYKSHAISNAELERFEAELHVRLPADYRKFLEVVGYGAGPYYGLLSPDQILDEVRWSDCWDDTPPEPSRPFPFSREQAEECWRIMGEGREAIFPAPTWPVDGCVPICDEGCTFYTLIVTAGDLTGSVWSSDMNPIDNDDDDENHLLYTYNLAPRPPGALLRLTSCWEPALSPLPTFLEWYNAWLDQCLSDLSALSDPQVGRSLFRKIVDKLTAKRPVIR